MNRPFQFYKCSQLFIGTHDKPLSLALGVDDPDRARMMLSGETQPTLNPALDILLTIVSYYFDCLGRARPHSPYLRSS